MSFIPKEKTRILFLMLLHLAVAAPLGFLINIWVDEASTLYTTNQGFVYALKNTLANEKQAPLYFLVMSLWREIDSSIFFARLFSIICSLAAIKFFYDLARSYWDEKFSFFAAFFFAAHPYLFWASVEIRGYSLMILLSVLLLKFFTEGFINTSKNARIFYALTALLALYTNYYLGFLLVGGFFALLLLKRVREARIYFLLMALVGVFFLPMMWIIRSQFDVRTSDYVPQTEFIEGVKILWNHFLTFVLPTEIYTTGEASAVSVLRVWIVRIFGLIVVLLLIFRKRISDEKIIVFGGFSAVAFVFYILIYLTLGDFYVEIRHSAVIFAPVLLLMFSALWEIKPDDAKKRIYYFAAIAVLLLGFYSYSIFNMHPNLTKRGDWARVARFIEENEAQNQPIIIFSNYDALALPFHYEGENKILPDEKFTAWNFEAEPGTPETYKSQIEYVVSIIPPDTKEIWLVTQEDCQTTQACLPLENFVRANYNTVIEKDFYLEKIRLLRKK